MESHGNPFAINKPRSADDAIFVGVMLGKQAQKNFEEMMGDDDEGPDEVLDAELSDEEEIVAGREKPWTKERIIEWMREELGAINAESDIKHWFTFNPDGTFESRQAINLSHRPIKVFPNGWVKADESVYAHETDISSLEHCPPWIGGSLSLSRTSIASLEHCPKHVGKNLIIADTKITSIKGLPPADNIGGFIQIDKKQAAIFEAELLAKGYNVVVV